MGLLDFIFPKRCIVCKKPGSYVCDKCFSYISFTDKDICIICQKAAIGGATHPVCRSKYAIDGTLSSIVYKGVVKKLLYRFKYKPYLSDLKHILQDLFFEGIIQKESFHTTMNRSSVLVPIPLYKTKYRKRGYNQAELLAGGISKKLHLPVLDCLERVKNTTPQFGLSQKERLENIKDAFVIKSEYAKRLAEYSQVFIVDDLMTTGATFHEAAKILKKNGIKSVWGLSLAHGV